MELQKETAPGMDEKTFCLKNQIFCRVLQKSHVYSMLEVSLRIHPLDVYALGLIWGVYVRMILPPVNAHFFSDCRFFTIDIKCGERVDDD